MTTKARQREAERATEAFHTALVAIGVETLSDAIVLWDEVPATDKGQRAGKWLDEAVKLTMGKRTLSVALAKAYYRLVRALRTGKTIADPDKPEPPTVTLAQLRSEFAEIAGPRVPESVRKQLPGATTPTTQQSGSSDQHSPAETDDDGSDEILVEEIKRLREQEEAEARAAEKELRDDLAMLGPVNQAKLVEKIDTSQPADTVDKQREDAHEKAGARQAAAAERVAMNGARSTVWGLAESDKRCLGYVRISKTGTPCGWCAMLISRGPVYKSQASASFKGGAASYDDGDKYHDNDHCIAMPVFSRDEFNSSDLFKLNREYADLWPQVTRGLSGKAAVSAWRRFIRTQQRAQEARH